MNACPPALPPLPSCPFYAVRRFSALCNALPSTLPFPAHILKACFTADSLDSQSFVHHSPFLPFLPCIPPSVLARWHPQPSTLRHWVQGQIFVSSEGFVPLALFVYGSLTKPLNGFAPLALYIRSLAKPSNICPIISNPAGIGFKACFTVAGQICISSNGFSFMLDKELLLVPIWVEPRDFPGRSRSNGEPGSGGDGGGTTMHLKYLPGVQDALVFKQIEKLNAGTLCFLRKLR